MHTFALVSPLPPRRQKSTGRNRSFYGPDDLWKRFSKIAATAGRSESELLVSVLTEWVEQIEAESALGQLTVHEPGPKYGRKLDLDEDEPAKK